MSPCPAKTASACTFSGKLYTHKKDSLRRPHTKVGPHPRKAFFPNGHKNATHAMMHDVMPQPRDSHYATIFQRTPSAPNLYSSSRPHPCAVSQRNILVLLQVLPVKQKSGTTGCNVPRDVQTCPMPTHGILTAMLCYSMAIFSRPNFGQSTMSVRRYTSLPLPPPAPTPQKSA